MVLLRAYILTSYSIFHQRSFHFFYHLHARIFQSRRVIFFLRFIQLIIFSLIFPLSYSIDGILFDHPAPFGNFADLSPELGNFRVHQLLQGLFFLGPSRKLLFFKGGGRSPLTPSIDFLGPLVTHQFSLKFASYSLFKRR